MLACARARLSSLFPVGGNRTDVGQTRAHICWPTLSNPVNVSRLRAHDGRFRPTLVRCRPHTDRTRLHLALAYFGQTWAEFGHNLVESDKLWLCSAKIRPISSSDVKDHNCDEMKAELGYVSCAPLVGWSRQGHVSGSNFPAEAGPREREVSCSPLGRVLARILRAQISGGGIR